MRKLKRSAVMCSTRYLAAINLIEKVLTSTVFCLFPYQIMGALFNKMIKQVWPRRVTLLFVWESSTYAVVIKGTPLFYGHIGEGGNCSS